MATPPKPERIGDPVYQDIIERLIAQNDRFIKKYGSLECKRQIVRSVDKLVEKREAAIEAWNRNYGKE